MDLTFGSDAFVSTNGDGGLFGEPVEPTAGAVFSPDHLYRYRLWRTIGESPRRCVFVMLNPSTADALVLDNTVRRCIGFANREGCGELWVVNLFAWRSTNPKLLAKVDDPIGYANDDHIMDTCAGADLVIGGWGAEPFARKRAQHVRAMLADARIRLHRLGVPTTGGQPGHPLYLDRYTPLVVDA